MKARQLMKDPGIELLYLVLPNIRVRVGYKKIIKIHYLKIRIYIMSPATAFFTQNETGLYDWGKHLKQ